MIHIEGKVPKLLVLLIFCIVLGGLFSVVAVLFVEPLFGIPFDEVSRAIKDLELSNNIHVLKFIQFFNTIGLFLLPGILFVVLLYKNPIKFLKLNKQLNSRYFILIVFLFFSFLPILNLIATINAEMHLPEWLSGVEEWMRNSEDSAAEITKAFLKMNGPTDLLFNVVLIGILPAIGEELIFRGIIQQTINKGESNYHIGIWVSAILFSALHFQFYGFLPRLLLGGLFGYLFFWSRNLWVPIFAHFLNNTFALLAVYYLGIDVVEKQVDRLGATNETYWFAIIGGMIFIGILIYAKRTLEKENVD